MKEDEQIVVDTLREELCLPDIVTDDEILKNTKGTLIRTFVDLCVARERFWSEIKRSLHFGK